MTKFVPTKFNIIRYRGSPQKTTVVLTTGEILKFERQKALLDPNNKTYIRCADYDDHFIFALPARIIGPTWQCTCGSAAVAVEYDMLKQDTSIKGSFIVCFQHISTGRHLTGGSRWI